MAQVTTCPGDCGGDGRVTASDVVMVTRVALGMNAEDHCSAADIDGSGSVDEAELRAAVEAVFSPCTPLSVEEVVALVLSTIRATERAALGLLSGFQFVNGAAEDAPPGSEPGACPQGGSQRRSCEILDDTFVSIPFEMDTCSYLGDDAFVTADGGFSLIGIGSCPGLFVLSGSRLILDLAVTTGLPPVFDFYDIALRGSIDEITLASGGCSLSYIAVPFTGAIDSQLAGGERLGIQTESGLLEASFGGQPCRPTAVSFAFDGRGGAHDTATTPFAAFEAAFDELVVSIDVTPRLSTVLDVSGAVTPACAARRLTLSSTVPLTWSNGCPTGGALRVGVGSQVIDVSFSADGTGAVDGDGEAEVTIDGCGGSVPSFCGMTTRSAFGDHLITSP
jgi:hypothetical protein